VPYTTNVAGTTITAGWGNANVRDQVVTPFATAAARTSAISSPVDGMASYRSDEGVFEGYVAARTAWQPIGWIPIATTTLGATATTITWSSIPATYRNLAVVCYARADPVVVSADVLVRFNNDTAANYSYFSWICNQADTTVTAATANGQTSMQSFIVPAASFGNSTSFGGGMMQILGYSNANGTPKTFHSWSAVADFGNAGRSRIRIGAWGANGGSPAAINRIDLICNGGNFIANSTFQLYGYGA
jgi:hypothetical protein